MSRIEDQLLAFLQRRCRHPGNMVAVDVLEGDGRIEVAWCRRCGAIMRSRSEWRLPNPNLWKGFEP